MASVALTSGPQTLLEQTLRQLSWALVATQPVWRLLDGIGEARAMPVVGAIAEALKPTQDSPYRLPPMMRLVDPAKLRC